MALASLSQIEKYFWPKGERRDTWMIVDGARDRRIFSLLLESHFAYSCLHSGELSPEMEVAAPYLVQLRLDDEGYSRRLISRAWGNFWGVFLKCDSRLEQLRRHLRQFLVVRDPKDRRLVFRYYDPRVLRVYLPTCLEDELQIVFGPIQCFWTEAKPSGDMLEFRFDGGKLVERALSLAPGATERSLGREPQTDDVRRSGALTRPGLLTIRQAQLRAFSQAEVQKFEERMIAHLRQFFPQQCAPLNEPKLRELIQQGIKRAADYNIVSERDVCKLVDLMIVFGRNFDTDRKSQWASKILGKREHPSAKMKSLLVAAKARLGNQ